MDGIALKPLTVAFHEPGFIATLQAENQQPFWFQMSADQRQRVGNPMGPANPQALNRYTYVLNSPLRYTDPSGHSIYLNAEQSRRLLTELRRVAREFKDVTTAVGIAGSIITAFLAATPTPIAASAAAALGITSFAGVGFAAVVGGGLGTLVAYVAGVQLDRLADQIQSFADRDGFAGVAIQNDNGILRIMDRASGDINSWQAPWWLEWQLPGFLEPGRVVGHVTMSDRLFPSD